MVLDCSKSGDFSANNMKKTTKKQYEMGVFTSFLLLVRLLTLVILAISINI